MWWTAVVIVESVLKEGTGSDDELIKQAEIELRDLTEFLGNE